MIKYKKGDLLEAEEDIIAHGVNCVGGFGSGVAGQIAKQFPFIKSCYLEKYRFEGFELGEIQIIECSKTFINCATQKEYLPRDQCHANYIAIRDCMNKVKCYAFLKNKSIAIPKIGCGLAGGDWNIVKPILEEVFNDFDVTVYEVRK